MKNMQGGWFKEGVPPYSFFFFGGGSKRELSISSHIILVIIAKVFALYWRAPSLSFFSL
jgi:hypothetical protein